MGANLVSCLMMTGADPERIPFAVTAVTSFVRQTWLPRELVIINQSEGLPHEFLLKDKLGGIKVPNGAKIRERKVTRPATLGELRNIGLETAAGNWWLPWDDDDWHHEDRIASMMAVRGKNQAVIPTCHVRYNVSTNTAFRYYNPGGCGGISLFSSKPEARYRALDREEDTFFMQDHYPQRVTWDNRGFAHIYLRFFHGRNVGDEKHIMKQFQGAGYRDIWVDKPDNPGYLCRDEVVYLKRILAEHYGLTFPNGIPWHGRDELHSSK